MKALLLIAVLAVSSAGYSMGGCKQPEPTPSESPVAGECLQDAPEGVHCKEADVYCTKDKKCHSSCDKCPK